MKTLVNIGVTAVFFSVAFLCPAQDNIKEYTYPYEINQARDPMQALVDQTGRVLLKEEEKKKDLWDLQLQGIMSSTEGNTAIINNEIYSAGQTVEGYFIRQVNAREVIVEKDGKMFSLKWEGGNAD